MKKPDTSKFSAEDWNSCIEQILDESKKQYPHSEWELVGMRGKLTQAIYDATRLDFLNSDERQDPYKFQTRLRNELDKPCVLQIIYQLGHLAGDRRSTREIINAKGDERKMDLMILAHGFRELLRDGWTWEQATQIAGEEYADTLALNDPAFLASMAKTAKTYQLNPNAFTRSAEAWVLRGWLSLGLWNCDGSEGAQRVIEARDILVCADAPMPPVPEPLDQLLYKVRHRLSAGQR